MVGGADRSRARIAGSRHRAGPPTPTTVTPPARFANVTTATSFGKRALTTTGAIAIAFVARSSLQPVLGPASPFLLFTPAVAVAAHYGGTAAGALATGVSAYLGTHFFLRAGEPPLETWDRIALFVLIGALITGLDGAARRSRRRIDESLARERAARADAEAATRAKDRFLAVVSHELQTPMAVVLGWAQALRRRSADPAMLEKAVSAIERNAALQSRLVSDLLDASRAATGRLRVDPETIDLSDVLRCAVEQSERDLAARGLQLILDIPPHAEPFVGDPVRLQQVFSNLIMNAIKFSTPPGYIRVALIGKPSDLVVTVTDSGAGIRSEFLPLVFDQFRQDDRTTSGNRGLGLGLAIARGFVEAHGGRIRAESDGPGRGARFIVSLPRTVPEGPAEQSHMEAALRAHPVDYHTTTRGGSARS
jgi:signal transduction histidine kinase